jgi:nucleotide-binding universal stress UspA family protein
LLSISEKETRAVKRFKNILLIANRGTSDQAILRRATSIAETNRAQLVVVDVIEELPRDMQKLIVVITPMEIQKRVIQERQKQLERLVAPIRKEGLRIGVTVLIGTPFLEIIQLVLRQKHDLVIMAAGGRNRLKGRLLGNTSLHLMRKCPCPVWVMKPTWRERFHRILAAVDPICTEEEKNLLNIKIMELATSLAKMEQSELHIVHAWNFRGDDLVGVRSRMSGETLDQLADQTRAIHKKGFEELIGNYSLKNLNHRLHFLKGDPAALITDLAAEHGIDLIVMGTVCRTGVAGFFIGNTAENVLQQVDCSVLTVKPEGFVSPVKLKAASSSGRAVRGKAGL